MSSQPTLTTPRLLLRPFTLADAPEVQRLAGDFAIADTTGNIPHPYPDGAAEAWIGSQPAEFEQGKSATFAIVSRAENILIGAIGLHFKPEHDSAEMGYWIGKPYWGQGYCTEAARALLAYGFNECGLNRIMARHSARNPASGRVMQKIGMTYEGCLRQSVKKWGNYEDLKIYGILKSELG